MIKGWFVGNFDQTALKTDACEVAVKNYTAGDYDQAHYHKIATEVTVISKGMVQMNEMDYVAGDIIVIEPNDVTDFKALTDAQTVVVKIPGELDDKYEVDRS
jgi:quercetin dioxygenase-like cupin family protein